MLLEEALVEQPPQQLPEASMMGLVEGHEPDQEGFTKPKAIHALGHANSLLVSGTRCFQSLGAAVLVEDSDEINVSSCTLCWQGAAQTNRRARA